MQSYHNLTSSKRHRNHNPELVEAVRDVVVPRLVPVVAIISNAFSDALPEAPSGGFVPRHNRRLFVTARRTFRGDLSARDKFAGMLGMSTLSADHVLALHTLLSPTFDPVRDDSRTEWELMHTSEAIRALVNRWEQIAKEEKDSLYEWGTKSVQPTLVDPLDPNSDPRAAIDPDLQLVFLRERIHSSLGDNRLAEVAAMHVLEFDWERPSQTTRLVAESLDMNRRTVLRDRDRVHAHPGFRREFWGALKEFKEFRGAL